MSGAIVPSMSISGKEQAKPVMGLSHYSCVIFYVIQNLWKDVASTKNKKHVSSSMETSLHNFYRGSAETNMQMSGNVQPKPHPPDDS